MRTSDTLIVGGIISRLYLNVSLPVLENAGNNICVELNISLGSLGTAVTYRYMSTELGIVISMGTEISYPIVYAFICCTITYYL